MEQNTITMQEVFTFERAGVGEFGETLGNFRPTGIRPQSLSRIESSGIHLPPQMFKEG
jgi:pilus assembly protein CpaF